jgi:hypothetical protein
VKTDKPQPTAQEAKEAADWVGDLLQRAEDGDASVLPKFREVLKSPEITDLLGNLARRVEIAMVDGATGGNLAMREGLTKRLAEMRAELAGPDPSPLERQLVERVALCWLAVHDAELRAATFSSPAPDQGDYWQRRIDHARKRHLSAIKALATVRKMAVPDIIGQINVAQRQVNKAEVRPAGAWAGHPPARGSIPVPTTS